VSVYLLSRHEWDDYDQHWTVNVGYTTDAITAAAWKSQPSHYATELQEFMVKSSQVPVKFEVKK